MNLNNVNRPCFLFSSIKKPLTLTAGVLQSNGQIITLHMGKISVLRILLLGYSSRHTNSASVQYPNSVNLLVYFNE